VNSSDPSQNQESLTSEANLSDASPTQDTMQEYYQLKQTLLLGTFALTGIIFISVWGTYSLNTALNYLIGACVGLVYLRMLAKDIESLGNQKGRLSSNRLALVIGIVVIASQLEQLQILPVFLGFMTYKVAILVYSINTALSTMEK